MFEYDQGRHYFQTNIKSNFAIMKKIITIMLTLLLSQIVCTQQIDYLKMLDIEIGASLNNVKNRWENSELSNYGILKTENVLTRDKYSFILFRDKSNEFIFTYNYHFIEDSLFSIILTNNLELNDANRFAMRIKNKFDISVKKDGWQFNSFTVYKENKKDGSTNSISGGVEPRKEKIKFSVSITNLRLADKRKLIFENFSTQNDSLHGFFDIKWKSSKEEVIKRMKLYKGVEIDSISEYRVDFSGGEFGEVKVSKWFFAFHDNEFYNLEIEFDSKAGTDDFNKLKDLLISHYGNEYNFHAIYEDQTYISVMDLYWSFYDTDNMMFYANTREMFANIYFRSCCDVEKAKPLRISYTYVPISKWSNYFLPKRTPQIVCPPQEDN